jgi:uncharacterized protein (DUF433 family)
MDPIADSSVVRMDAEIHSGAACFAGTRVPVSLLFAYLAEGKGFGVFMENHPSVTREQVERLLGDLYEHAERLELAVEPGRASA